jgi:hypothetical protein
MLLEPVDPALFSDGFSLGEEHRGRSRFMAFETELPSAVSNSMYSTPHKL